jgi:hypothetical protein
LIATCIPLHYEDTARQKRFAKYVGSQLWHKSQSYLI